MLVHVHCCHLLVALGPHCIASKYSHRRHLLKPFNFSFFNFMHCTRGPQRCYSSTILIIISGIIKEFRMLKDKKVVRKVKWAVPVKSSLTRSEGFITNHLPPKLCTTFQHILTSWFLEHPSKINNDTSVWVRILSLFLKQDLFPLCFCCQVSSGMWGGDGRLLCTWCSFTTSQTLRQQGERRALKTQSENLHSVSVKEWKGGAEPVIGYRSDR